jgi:hypothetical protein
MKLGYIFDCSVQDSFYVKDNVAYDFFKNQPYVHSHAISPSLHVTGWNFPFLWGDGCFLNLQQWIENDLDFPDYDLDIILYANERLGLDDDKYQDYGIEKLRKKYSNATIIAYGKEIELSVHNREVRSKNRIKFFKECDNIIVHGISTMKDLNEHREFESLIGKKFNYISHPINIDLYYDTFYSNEKEESIFAYLPNPVHRRSDTYNFADYIGKKYNIPVKFKPLESNQKFDYLSLKQFIELWSPSSFHFNLDPSFMHPGQQCIQVANVGSIQMGGLNESHHILFPETATCDRKILEEKFEEYLKDLDKRFEVIEYAWDKLNENYSYDFIKKQLLDILENN